MSNTLLYDQDFYAWTQEQAGLLREAKLDQADILNIAEEIESMGRAEKRELTSRLTILLLHLLKWQHQPSHRGASWRASIANARDDIADHLDDNPSLRATFPAAVTAAYRRARRQAAAETGLEESLFSLICPWPPSKILAPSFWP
jgi:hypothetical protein